MENQWQPVSCRLTVVGMPWWPLGCLWIVWSGLQQFYTHLCAIRDPLPPSSMPLLTPIEPAPPPCFSWFPLEFHWFLWFYETFFAPKPWIFGQKTMDFHETLLTLTWCSSELRRSLRTSRHVFNTYSRRSREWRGPYRVRISGRNRKNSRHSEIFRDFQVPGHWPP